MEGQQRSAPKFSSFRPPAKTNADAGPSVLKIDSSRRKKRYGSPNPDDDSLHAPRERKSVTELGSYHQGREKKRSKKHVDLPIPLDRLARRPTQYTLEDSGQSFYEDPFGASGTLYQEVTYWPTMNVRNVMGVPNTFRVWRDNRSGEFEVWVPFSIKSRRDVAKQFRAAARQKTYRLLPSQTTTLKGEEEGFIPIPKNKEAPRDAVPSYRAIEQYKDAEFDDEGYASSDDDDDIPRWVEADNDITDAYSAETARLNAVLEQDVTNISSWLNIITHSASTNPTIQGRAELTLTMLQKAIAAHPKNRMSDTLQLRYLAAVRDARGSKEENAAWDKAILELKSENVWVEYISYRLAKFGPEGIDEAVIRVMSEVSNSAFDDGRKFLARMRIFWRAVTALREAGFIERATAAMQAQLELTYFSPSDLENAPFSNLLEEFERFWDADVPRIGEGGACGWLNWQPDSKDTREGLSKDTALVSVASLNYELTKGLDGYQRWASTELQLDIHGWRPTSDPNNDDPFSTILFSDIRPLLFPPAPLSNMSTLLVALQMLGLHVPGLSQSLVFKDVERPHAQDESLDTSWSYTQFSNKPKLTNSLFAFGSDAGNLPPHVIAHHEADGGKTTRSVSGFEGLVIGRERRMGDGWGPVKDWSLGILAPLDGHGPRGEGRMWESHDLEGVDNEFCRGFFQQTSTRLNSEVWVEYWIAYEAACSIKEALQISKTVLSTYPESIRLWIAHAQLQRMRGKKDAARKVYQTCLGSMSTGNAGLKWLYSADAAERARMWYVWAEMEWFQGGEAKISEKNFDAALAVLCAMVGVQLDLKSDTRLPLLRARKAYTNVLQLEGLENETKISFLRCLALLELIHTGDVSRTLATFDDHRSCFSRSGFAASKSLEECLAVNSTLLIHHHTLTLRATAPPALMRKHVAGGMQKYPGNTIILGAWLESERGEAVWGRVRSGVADTILDSGQSTVSAARWVWAIWVERWERSAWDANRARGTIKRILADDARSRQSPVIWRVLLELELHLAATLNQPAKTLHNSFFQCIDTCRWFKGAYLSAFITSRPTFTTDILRSTIDSMAERGVRLRAAHNLEDYLTDQADTDLPFDIQGNDWGEADIEHNASELARLKPY